jgi:hypothetical protein
VNDTGEAASAQAFPALARSFGRAARAKALGELAKERRALPVDADGLAVPKPPKPAERTHAGLEELTESFRSTIAHKHIGRALEERKRYDLAAEEWVDVVAGEAPPHPCRNVFWRRGAAAPAKTSERCSSTHKVGGVPYRCALHAGHEGDHEASKKRVPCPCAPCVLRDSLVTRSWHLARRFDRVRSCGSRMRTASCGVCGTDRRAVPEGCGVRRVCSRCDALGAIARRARFGRARGRAFVDGHRFGLFRKLRTGGRFTEKMLTLTVPHAMLDDASGKVAKESRDTLHARVVALFSAWPVFLRKVNRHWQACGQDLVTYHRAFEWTPGRTDEHGHPHFHVYLWSPFVDVNLLRAWWAEALRSVGWPVAEDNDGNPVVRIKLQMLRSMDLKAVRELMKGGRRQALTLSRVEFRDREAGAEFRRGPQRGQPVGPGIDAFKYAEGWTLATVEECSDDVRARLYMALEGRRLTQASRGFFVADERAACTCCGASMFRVRFDGTQEAGARFSTPFESWKDRQLRKAIAERAPPDDIPASTRVDDRRAGEPLAPRHVQQLRDATSAARAAVLAASYRGHGAKGSRPSPRARRRANGATADLFARAGYDDGGAALHPSRG